MNDKLYDVVELKPGATEGTFLMRAPIDLIIRLLDLHRDAKHRIESEAVGLTGECELHHSRGRFAGTVHKVALANE